MLASVAWIAEPPTRSGRLCRTGACFALNVADSIAALACTSGEYVHLYLHIYGGVETFFCPNDLPQRSSPFACTPGVVMHEVRGRLFIPTLATEALGQASAAFSFVLRCVVLPSFSGGRGWGGVQQPMRVQAHHSFTFKESPRSLSCLGASRLPPPSVRRFVPVIRP